MTANRDSSPEGGNDCGTDTESETITLSTDAETMSSLVVETIEEADRRGVDPEVLGAALRNHGDRLTESGFEEYQHPIAPEVVRGEP